MTMLIAFLKENPGASVTLQGHLDPLETQDRVGVLGEKRARAVREALVAAGVDPSRIRLASGGTTSMICSDQQESCWELTRRVEVRIEQPGS